MKQHHYLFNSLDELQSACYDLEQLGIQHGHLLVASSSPLSLEKRGLNSVALFGDSDIVHSGLRGLLFGVLASVASGTAVWFFFGTHQWGVVIAGFVALIALGFCTWIGGLVGVSHDNWRLSPYHDQLEQGKSLLLVEVVPDQEQPVTRLMTSLHRQGVHTGESSSFESPFAGDWNLHLKTFR